LLAGSMIWVKSTAAKLVAEPLAAQVGADMLGTASRIPGRFSNRGDTGTPNQKVHSSAAVRTARYCYLPAAAPGTYDMSWPLSDHDRRADSQSGAGGTAHQLMVMLYFQRPVAGPRWYSTDPTRGASVEGRTHSASAAAGAGEWVRR
jgi:hypothetical protein